MDNIIICTRASNLQPHDASVRILAVAEMQIGKCRGCMRCKIMKQCISYSDDAQQFIPVINAAAHLDIYLQLEGDVRRLLDRVLYALDGKGKTFAFYGEGGVGEEAYLRRLLVWAGYTEKKINV